MSAAVEARLDNIMALRNLAETNGQFTTWSALARPSLTEIQTETIGGDAGSKIWMATNRYFFKNNGVLPLTITLGGQAFSITNGVSYSCSLGELSKIVTEATSLGGTFAVVDVVEFIATGVAVAFFE